MNDRGAADTPVERRLSGILSADVKGYSRLMRDDEVATVRMLTTYRALIGDVVRLHHGRVVDAPGDNLLAEFRTVMDTVTAAVEIQRALGERNADVDPGRRMEFRIGINLGEVLVDGERIYGDGVNIAARLEGLADAGGVVIAASAWDQVRNKILVTAESMGEQRVKNVEEPVRAFKLVLGPSSVSATAPPLAPALPDRPSIAVLPFANLSGDPEQEYLADGITEELITALAHLRWLFVIGRNSTFVYKGRAVDARQVGRELGVRYVLEGSVRRSGARVRITAQLVEAATGGQILTERYDGVLADVFDLQDEITEKVAGALEPSLRHAEIERARRKHPERLDAWDQYLRALQYAYSNTPESPGEAIRLLEKALTLDPHLAAAHGVAALTYEQRFARGGGRAEDRVAAIRHARAALAHGIDDATALTLGGFVVAMLDHDHAAGLAALRQALALNPNSSLAYGIGSMIHVIVGDYATGIEHAERALRLSPLDPLRFGPLVAIGFAMFFTGRFDAAVDAAARAIHVNPAFLVSHAILAAANASRGREEEARTAAARCLALQPTFHAADFARLGFPPDATERFTAAVRAAGLPQ
jgi:TolB-like protein